MTRDMTYCNNKKCPLKNSCMRNIINNRFEEWELIWQSDFYDEDKECDYYIEK